MSSQRLICSLCGTVIDSTDKTSPDAMSMDHVPPRQFYPKAIRVDGNLNLWVTPTHRRCNSDYKNDEEYFYHTLYALVANENRKMGQTIREDIGRRARKPQSRRLIRRLLKTARTETEYGIHLPPGVVQLNVDNYRIERIAIKIAQGVFFRDHAQYLPRDKCRDIRFCERVEDIPEMYSNSWALAEPSTVCREVFSYRISFLDGMYFFSLLFWEAFMCCMVFDSPGKPNERKGDP